MTSDVPEEVEEERWAVVSEERTRRRGLLLEAKALLVQDVVRRASLTSHRDCW